MAVFTVNLQQASGVGDVSLGDGTTLATLAVSAGRGPKGDGFTGGTYDAGTGKVTFTSNDGIGFETGDLRGDLTEPGPIGSVTPSTGAFTSLSTTGDAVFAGATINSPITGNAVQSSPADTTIGRLMPVGAFGLGVEPGTQPVVISDIDDEDIASGFYSVTSGTAGTLPPGAANFSFVFVERQAQTGVKQTFTNGNGTGQFYRVGSGGPFVWRDWQEFYTTENISEIDATDQQIFKVDGTEYARIDSSGKVGIGTSSPAEELHVYSGNAPVVLIEAAAGNDSRLRLLTPNDRIGFIEFGDAADSDTGEIRYEHSSNNMVFSTNGTSEAMRIVSSGNVGIGTSSPSRGPLHLNVGSVPTELHMTNAGTGTGSGDGFTLFMTDDGNGAGVWLREAEPLRFATSSTERMRIDSSGNVGIGTSSPDEILHATDFVKADKGFYAGQSKSLSSNNTTTRFVVTRAGSNTRLWQASNTDQPLFLMHRSTTTGPMLRFVQGDPSTTVGSISVTTTSTAYNTSSDYRLKEDLKPVPNPSDRVLALNPVNFAWKVDGSRVDGFLAHEAQEVVPGAVTGEKDGEEMQAIDQSKLVPLLTAALQDALKRIEALEAQLNP